MNPVAMTLLLLTTLGWFSWAAHRRWRQLRVGAADPSFTLADGELFGRLKDTFVYAFGQKKMPYYRLAGVAHIAIFLGFQVLLLNSIQLWVRGYDPTFDFWGILAHDAPLGIAYGFLKDTLVAAVIAGASVFVYLRVIKTKRMTLGFEGMLILGIIIT
ncbi:MAG: (Fe-S)-binding protein, partial [Myxococcota bacterium]